MYYRAKSYVQTIKILTQLFYYGLANKGFERFIGAYTFLKALFTVFFF